MKTMIKFCGVLFFVAAANMFAQTNMPQDKQMFQDLNNKWNKTVVDRDLNALVDFYVDDAVSLPNNAPLQRGKDEIREANKKDFAQTKYLSLTSKTTDVYGTGDVAIEIGTYEISLIPAHMTEAIKDHGKYLTVWQKQSDGTWKIKADTYNTDMSPMAQTQAGAKEKDMYENKDKDNDK